MPAPMLTLRCLPHHFTGIETMVRHARTAPVLAGLAALSMAASPAAAADLVAAAAPAHAGPAQAGAWGGADVAAEHSRWRHRDRRWHRHRDRGIDAGDVIAGVLILGGIAAVASAMDNDTPDRRADYRPPRDDYRNGGLDRAAQMCVARIERDVRVASVDAVDRTARGWRVEGALYDGERFTCHIGNDGRIDDIDFGRGGVTYRTQARDGQWSDATYAAAWSNVDRGAATVPAAPAAQPAYPGGPLPGEPGYPEGEYDHGG